MGAARNTTQNIEVVSVDDEDGVILLHGAVPGPKNGWVLISDAKKAKLPEGAPFPAGLAGEVSGDYSEEAPAEAVLADVAPVADAVDNTAAVADEALTAAAEDTATESTKE